VERRERPGLHYVLASDGQCTRRGSRQPARVHWGWDLERRLREHPRVPAADREDRPDVRDSVMFRAVSKKAR
jgi:hypothetical protein